MPLVLYVFFFPLKGDQRSIGSEYPYKGSPISCLRSARKEGTWNRITKVLSSLYLNKKANTGNYLVVQLHYKIAKDKSTLLANGQQTDGMNDSLCFKRQK